MDHWQEAEDLLVWYFRAFTKKIDMKFDEDNEAEVRAIFKHLRSAVEKEIKNSACLPNSNSNSQL